MHGSFGKCTGEDFPSIFNRVDNEDIFDWIHLTIPSYNPEYYEKLTAIKEGINPGIFCPTG